MEKIFSTLNKVNVNDKVEKKNGLTYLSWSYAWEVIKSHYPTANYRVIKNADGWNYHHDGRTAWVEVGVTINGLEYIEMLPVMNHRNQSIELEKVTSFEVNKSIKRCLAKACALHGLGLYIYNGEDLPTEEKEEIKKQAQTQTKTSGSSMSTGSATTIKDVIEQVDPTDVELINALNKIDVAKNKAELMSVYSENANLHSNGTFMMCLSTKKKMVC